MEEARRVVKPGGTIVVSFLEFAEPVHWPVFSMLLANAKRPDYIDPLSVFIERDALRVWAPHLGLEIVEMHDAAEEIAEGLYLGQSLCVLRRPHGE